MKKNREGFTLMEMLVVIFIMIILSGASFLMLGGVKTTSDVKKTLSELKAAVTATQKRSMTQDAGNRWNVRFQNYPATGSQFLVYSSSSYSAGVVERTYTLGRGLVFSEPSSNAFFDANFAPMTGTLPGKKAITIVTGRKDGLVGNLMLNSSGLISDRFESGVYAYWHFDENTLSTAYDASGTGNPGTLASAGWLTGSNCLAGSCVQMVNDASQVTATINGTFNDFTVTFWQYVTNIQGGTELLNFRLAGTSFYSYEGGLFRVVDPPFGCTSPGTFGSSNSSDYLNKWSMLALVRSGSTVSVYVNGTLASTCTSTNATLVNPYLQFGNVFSARNMLGNIDEVKMYNRALTPTELLNQYNDLK